MSGSLVTLASGEVAQRVVIYGAPSAEQTSDAPIGSSTSTPVITSQTVTGKYGEATFTPAASSHTAGDCNGAAQDFALGAPSGCLFLITDCDLYIDGGTAEATAWRLYLYTVTPPSALADDAAWDLPSGDRASHVGYVDLGTAVDLGSTQGVQNAGINRTVKLAGTTLFGYLVNLTTLTPAAVAHRVRLKGTPL